MRANKEVVLKAVRINGVAFQFASPELKMDRDVVLQAMRSNKDMARFYADPAVLREITDQVVNSSIALCGEPATVCTVSSLTPVSNGINVQATIGLSGREVDFEVPQDTRLNDLADRFKLYAQNDRMGNVDRVYILIDTESVSPFNGNTLLINYINGPHEMNSHSHGPACHIL